MEQFSLLMSCLGDCMFTQQFFSEENFTVCLHFFFLICVIIDYLHFYVLLFLCVF